MDDLEILKLQADNVKSELDLMLDKGDITELDYYKQIIGLSYLFCINGCPDDGFEMLMNVPEDFFRSEAEAQLEVDKQFFAQCLLIHEVMGLAGYLPYDTMATQQEAKA